MRLSASFDASFLRSSIIDGRLIALILAIASSRINSRSTRRLSSRSVSFCMAAECCDSGTCSNSIRYGAIASRSSSSMIGMPFTLAFIRTATPFDAVEAGTTSGCWLRELDVEATGTCGSRFGASASTASA